jgi:hypothetical protein
MVARMCLCHASAETAQVCEVCPRPTTTQMGEEQP